MAVAAVKRKKLYGLIDRLPENKLSPVIDYVTDYLNEEPNAETVAAFEDIEAGRNLIGPFDDVDSLFKALMEGDDDEI